MALFYIYVFMHKGREVYFYADQEKNAREDFTKTFKSVPGALLRRENW